MSSQPLKIIILEDNDDSRESIIMLLRLQGHEVTQARDGKELIAILEREGRDAFDVLIIDVGLPGGKYQGIAVAAEVNERWQLQSILYTGYDDPDLIQAWTQPLHILGYISKPPRTGQLDTALTQARRETSRIEELRTIFAAMSFVANRGDISMWDSYERIYAAAKSSQKPVANFCREHLPLLQAFFRKLGFKYPR